MLMSLSPPGSMKPHWWLKMQKAHSVHETAAELCSPVWQVDVKEAWWETKQQFDTERLSGKFRAVREAVGGQKNQLELRWPWFGEIQSSSTLNVIEHWLLSLVKDHILWFLINPIFYLFVHLIVPHPSTCLFLILHCSVLGNIVFETQQHKWK